MQGWGSYLSALFFRELPTTRGGVQKGTRQLLRNESRTLRVSDGACPAQATGGAGESTGLGCWVRTWSCDRCSAAWSPDGDMSIPRALPPRPSLRLEGRLSGTCTGTSTSAASMWRMKRRRCGGHDLVGHEATFSSNYMQYGTLGSSTPVHCSGKDVRLLAGAGAAPRSRREGQGMKRRRVWLARRCTVHQAKRERGRILERCTYSHMSSQRMSHVNGAMRFEVASGLGSRTEAGSTVKDRRREGQCAASSVRGAVTRKNRRWGERAGGTACASVDG